ncbi:MAG: hypothetical protein J7L11_07485 [Thermoprotei archaeon]|nr:hypothetical protein [Thermoprotei archaeon]
MHELTKASDLFSKPYKWVLIAALTFGAGFIVMAYNLLKERNAHFKKQYEISTSVIRGLGVWLGRDLLRFARRLSRSTIIRDERLWLWCLVISFIGAYPLALLLLGFLQYLLITDLDAHVDQELMLARILWMFLSPSFVEKMEGIKGISRRHKRFYVTYMAACSSFLGLLISYIYLGISSITSGASFTFPLIALALCATSLAVSLMVDVFWWLDIIRAYEEHLYLSEEALKTVKRKMFI